MNAAKDNAQSVDLLNIGLIFISLFAAFILPFHLFLFSYAVLGPLHYLTEINWLKEKNYFVKNRKWIWVFVVMAICFSVPALLRLPSLKNVNSAAMLSRQLHLRRELIFAILSFTFLFAITLVYARKWQLIFLLLLLNLAVNIAIYKFKLFSFVLIGIFLPTILHVYLFTLLFMLYGTMKSKSAAGYIACALLLLCPLFIWFSTIDPINYPVSDEVRNTFTKTNFNKINAIIARFLGVADNSRPFYLLSKEGVKIQIFISFCYTYHYLNWFSKTSVIGWGRTISRPRLVILLLVWLCSVALYWYDYQLGLTALLIMSILHVFFEFPLNVLSIDGILTGLFRKAK